MARYIGQIQGTHLTNSELMYHIRANANTAVARVIKIGIQLEKARKVMLNKNLEFEIGKTGMLEFDDVEITSIQLLKTEAELEESKKNNKLVIRVPVIIDYIYEDE